MLRDAACLAQHLPDGGLRARQAHPGSFEHRITVDEIENGFWSWNALQVLRRLHADLQNALHHGRLRGDGEWWGAASTGARVQRHDIVRIGPAQELSPLAHPRA
jgi:hypothetical protein